MTGRKVDVENVYPFVVPGQSSMYGEDSLCDHDFPGERVKRYGNDLLAFVCSRCGGLLVCPIDPAIPRAAIGRRVIL